MADFDPSDRAQPLHAPAAPLSADEIAEMRREIDVALAKSDAEFPFHALAVARHMPRLLDAVEALTAENARLTNSLEMRRTEIGVMEKGMDNACATINVLRSEVAQLRGEKLDMRDERDAARAEVERLKGQIGAWMVTASKDAFKARAAETQLRELGAQYLADFGQAYQPEAYATTDHDWYSHHRLRVEAAHAAAKEAERREQRARDDNAMASVAARDMWLSANEAPGIDMELLGKLCREEPDEATKREVESMMDKLNGGS